MIHRNTMSRTARRLVAGIGAVAVLVVAACEGILSVDSPTQVAADVLNDPAHANLLVQGVISDFDCALGGYIVSQALLGDELHDGTFTAARWPTPSRTLSGTETYGTSGCAGLGVYTPLSTARWTADDALRKLDGWTDAEVENRMQKIGVVAAYSGYAHVLLGEGMCTVAFDVGPELQPVDAFTRAEERFTRAIQAATAAADDTTLWMALVGRARARLNMGNEAGAAADAQLVPAGFVKWSVRSDVDARSRNRVAAESPWSNGSGTAGASTSVKEPFRNVTTGGVADPRVSVTDMARKTGDALTDDWRQNKYQGPAVPIPIARYAEAQLIIAETAGGQTAVNIINALRAPYGLPEFSSTDEAEIQAEVLEERRKEFFLEGHRLGDIRRHNLPLVPAAGTPYPKSGTYGDLRCFPLPAVERLNNPNIPD